MSGTYLNSLESLHYAEAQLLAEVGAATTPSGLCTSLEASREVCALANERFSEWWWLPWLLTEYPS